MIPPQNCFPFPNGWSELKSTRFVNVLGLAELSSFPYSSPQSSPLPWWLEAADNSPVLWVLLSRAGTAPVLSLNIPHSSLGWGWARPWEGTEPGQLTQTHQKDKRILIWFANKTKGEGGERRGAFAITTFVFQSNRYEC